MESIRAASINLSRDLMCFSIRAAMWVREIKQKKGVCGKTSNYGITL